MPFALSNLPWSPTRSVIAYGGISASLMMGALGQIFSFLPGAQLGYFATAAVFAAAGLLSSRRGVQILALALVIVLACLSWWGYLEGLRYEEFLRQRSGQGAI